MRLTRRPGHNLPPEIELRRYSLALGDELRGLPILDAPKEEPLWWLEADEELHETAPWAEPETEPYLRTGNVNATLWDLRQVPVFL